MKKKVTRLYKKAQMDRYSGDLYLQRQIAYTNYNLAVDKLTEARKNKIDVTAQLREAKYQGKPEEDIKKLEKEERKAEDTILCAQYDKSAAIEKLNSLNFMIGGVR